MTEIQIIEQGERIVLNCRFHPNLSAVLRPIGGQWDGVHWVLKARDADRARAVLRSVFGYDDGEEPERIDVRVAISPDARAWDPVARNVVERPVVDGSGGELWLFGRCLATRRGRDSRVQLGEDVIVVAGGFPKRGGSVKNPALAPEEGTVLEVRGVPVLAFQAALERGCRGIEVVAPEPPAGVMERMAALVAAEMQAGEQYAARVASLRSEMAEVGRSVLGDGPAATRWVTQARWEYDALRQEEQYVQDQHSRLAARQLAPAELVAGWERDLAAAEERLAECRRRFEAMPDWRPSGGFLLGYERGPGA